MKDEMNKNIKAHVWKKYKHWKKIRITRQITKRKQKSGGNG